MGMVDAPDGGAALRATAAAQPHDPGFAPFVRRAQAAGIPVEVVSDGFGFYIGPALASLGLADLPAVTNRTVFVDGGARIDFPNGHPTCFICGTCKRARVLEHRAAGRAVVFIGDGESDRYAAGHADVIFAKRALVPICVTNGWPFRRWTDFAEIDLWLAETIAAWRTDPASPSVPGPPDAPVHLRSRGLGPGPVRPARGHLTVRARSGPARLSGPTERDWEERPGLWTVRPVERRTSRAASSAASAGRRFALTCPTCGTRQPARCPVLRRVRDGPSGRDDPRRRLRLASVEPTVTERRLVSVLFADLVGFTTVRRGPRPRGGPRAADALLRARPRGHRPLRRHDREVHRRRGHGRVGHADRPTRTTRSGPSGPSLDLVERGRAAPRSARCGPALRGARRGHDR